MKQLLTLMLLVLGGVLTVTASAQSTPPEAYIVQADDWLSKIAEKYYGDPLSYPLIVTATNAAAASNPDIQPIDDPDRIEVGQTLLLSPPEPGPAATPATTASPGSAAPDLPLLAELAANADTPAVSSDGGLLAVGNYRGEVQVWNSATWDLRWQTTHDEAISAVAFSPAGTRLASGGFDGTARLWDIATGLEVDQLTFDYWVTGVDFSADGKYWAAGSLDGRAVVVDADGRRLREFKRDLPVTQIAISPTGPWLAMMTAGKWGPVRLWVADFLTGEERLLAERQGPPNQSNVLFSPDTGWLAASLGGTVQVWQTGIWSEVAQLTPAAGYISKLAFSPDSRRLAAIVLNGEANSQVLVWEVPTWQQIAILPQPDIVWDIDFSSDGRRLATALGQGIEVAPAFEGQLWDVDSEMLLGRMPHQRQVLAVVFSPNGRWLATGSNDGSIRIWQAP